MFLGKILYFHSASLHRGVEIGTGEIMLAYQAGAYPGFCSMKQLGVFLLPLDGMLVHRKVIPSSKFTCTHLYTRVERGTMRVKCLAQVVSYVGIIMVVNARYD